MARYRTIKPRFYNDRALASCSIQARYLFKALWVFADDLGVIINEPNWIKSQVFPYDKALRVEEVVKWLDALVTARMIEPFTFKGESFYNIRSFRTHQKIDRPNYEDVNVPEEEFKNILNDLSSGEGDNSTSHRRTFDELSSPEKSRKEKRVKEKNVIEERVETHAHFFKDSEIFDKEVFEEKLKGTAYEDANVEWYHERALNWSDGNEAKKKNWLYSIKNWMLEDMRNGKFITKNFQPPNGKQSGTNVSTQSAFDKIDQHYAKNGGAKN